MHPELLRALAQAHRRDLLDRHGFWDDATEIPNHGVLIAAPRVPRARHWAGRILVLAGTRLMGPQRAPLTLVHD
ncbi:MAG TPA: hypothetical protein VGG38_06575 [Acidimicrobiales bacterium]|jgi:hypothetical protein